MAATSNFVRQIEQLFAFADQLEAKVASAKNRIDHLTQSILAKAFRGELVPQETRTTNLPAFYWSVSKPNAPQRPRQNAAAKHRPE